MDTSKLEAELGEIDAQISLTESEPTIADRSARIASELSGHESTAETHRREQATLRCQIDEMKGFSKKGLSHRETLRFAIERLRAAANGEGASDLITLLQFHRSINALDWWSANADLKISALVARAAKHERAAKAAEALAAPLKSELADLKSKLKQLRQDKESSIDRGLVSWGDETGDEGKRESARTRGRIHYVNDPGAA